MCLTLTNSPLDFVEGKRTCYKVVEKNIDTGEYQSFYIGVPHDTTGWLISDRESKSLDMEETVDRRIQKGIHVLNSLEGVNAFLDYEPYVTTGWEIAVLEVECHLEDLVANGRFYAIPSSVWMKVLIKGEVDLKEVTP